MPRKLTDQEHRERITHIQQAVALGKDNLTIARELKINDRTLYSYMRANGIKSARELEAEARKAKYAPKCTEWDLSDLKNIVPCGRPKIDGRCPVHHELTRPLGAGPLTSRKGLLA